MRLFTGNFKSLSKRIWFMLFLLFCCINGNCKVSFAKVFYVDPVNGSILNDGSMEHPWSTFQEVFESNKIHTRSYATPYDPNNPILVEKNPNAPVQPGDTILLLSGYHGAFILSKAVNSAPITVKAAPNAQPKFGWLRIQASSNWIFDGLDISLEYLPVYDKKTVFWVESHNYSGPSSYITLKNSTLSSVEDVSKWTSQDWLARAGDGVMLNGAHSLVDHVKIRNVAFGISIYNAPFSSVYSSVIDGFCEDGIRVAGSDYAQVKYNIVKNVYYVDADNHYDLLQAWAIKNDTDDDIVDYGVEIIGNMLILTESEDRSYLYSAQGIGMFDGWFDNFNISNNLIVTNSYHGLSIYGARNSVVINNTIVPVYQTIEPLGKAPLYIFPHKDGTPGYGNIVRNNLVRYISFTNNGIDGGAIADHNIVNFSLENDFVDSKNLNFALKKGSIAVDAGNADLAPSEDIRRLKRDSSPDVGAYEFYEKLSPPAKFATD